MARKRKPRFEEQTFEGTGASLDEAVGKAIENAKNEGFEDFKPKFDLRELPFWLVKSIYVKEVEGPVRGVPVAPEYTVAIDFNPCHRVHDESLDEVCLATPYVSRSNYYARIEAMQAGSGERWDAYMDKFMEILIDCVVEGFHEAGPAKKIDRALINPFFYTGIPQQKPGYKEGLRLKITDPTFGYHWRLTQTVRDNLCEAAREMGRLTKTLSGPPMMPVTGQHLSDAHAIVVNQKRKCVPGFDPNQDPMCT